MSEETVNTILDTIYKLWTCNSNVEISLEANPTSVEAKKFQSFRKSGVNRLSMGIQALDDNDLKRLGRLHTVKDAKEAFNIASKHFDRVSFDLMYGRQYQTLKDWEIELSTAIDMSIGHLSLYQLTIEENTRFGDLFAKGKLLGLPQDDMSVNFYNLTQSICDSHGLPAYEISNHAKKNQECQHNITYWKGFSFLGVGPGAHGRVNIGNKRYLTEAPSHPEEWLKLVQKEKIHEFKCKSISNNEQAEEYVIMGLRLKEGINLSHYNQLAKTKLPESVISELINDSLIKLDNQILTTTKAGKVLTNYVIRRLLC